MRWNSYKHISSGLTNTNASKSCRTLHLKWITVIINILVDCDFGFQEPLDVYFMFKVAHFPTNALQQIALQTADNTKESARLWNHWRGGKKKKKHQHKRIKVLIHKFGAVRQSWLITSSRGRDGSKVSHIHFFPLFLSPPATLSPSPKSA